MPEETPAVDTPLDLDAIDARRPKLRELDIYLERYPGPRQDAAVALADQDALAAEVRRLRAANAALGAELDRAQGALWGLAKAVLVVEPLLKQPYEDHPEWTPYTRWVQQPAREAYDARTSARKLLRAAGEGK